MRTGEDVSGHPFAQDVVLECCDELSLPVDYISRIEVHRVPGYPMWGRDALGEWYPDRREVFAYVFDDTTELDIVVSLRHEVYHAYECYNGLKYNETNANSYAKEYHVDPHNHTQKGGDIDVQGT